MIVGCLWGNAPCSGVVRCLSCRAVEAHLPFHCTKGLGHLPTLGDSCPECDDAAAYEKRQPTLRDLQHGAWEERETR